MNIFDREVIKAIKKPYEERPGEVYRHILVKHEDGSEFLMKHAHYEQILLKNGKRTVSCVLVYPEHNTVNIFPEMDLELVEIRPWKGRRFKLKLNKS